MFVLILLLIILGVSGLLIKIGYDRGWFLGNNHFHKSNK